MRDPDALVRRPGRARRIAFAALLVLLAPTLAACSDDTAAGPDGSEPDATDTPASTTTTTAPPIVGEPVNRYTLVVGDCFNRYETGTDIITTRVPCEAAHDYEVFAAFVHPAPFGDPWPGDDALQRYGLRACYQTFESFAGIIYELSVLGIGVATPPRENWEDERARYRGITCYVQRNDGEPLVGSMRGKGV